MVAPIFFFRSRISVERSSATAGMNGSLFFWRGGGPTHARGLPPHDTPGGGGGKPAGNRGIMASPARSLVMTEPRDFDLVVIGAGPAGVNAAVTAALLGKRVAVAEKAPAVGGAAINTGTVPSKTLRET